MGGKSYYCDYCDCYMKNDMIVRKSHNLGMLHKMAKANYMQRFRDPKEILEEERRKVPCKRIINGLECKFGLFCYYSHYTSEQLAYLESLCQRNGKSPEDKGASGKSKRLKQFSNITPSLEPIDFTRFTKACLEKEWG